MDIYKFLTQRTGKWFAQRTSYYLDSKIVENSKAEITIEQLSLDDPEIVKLSQQHHLTLTDTSQGIKISWDNSVDWGKTKQIGSITWLVIPDPENEKTGKLFRSNCQGMGSYKLANDEALTLTLEQGDQQTEERHWFASENLFLRSMFIKKDNQFIQTSFYSEIRKMLPKE